MAWGWCRNVIAWLPLGAKAILVPLLIVVDVVPGLVCCLQRKTIKFGIRNCQLLIQAQSVLLVTCYIYSSMTNCCNKWINWQFKRWNKLTWSLADAIMIRHYPWIAGSVVAANTFQDQCRLILKIVQWSRKLFLFHCSHWLKKWICCTFKFCISTGSVLH